MRKIITFVLVLTLLIGGLSSCKSKKIGQESMDTQKNTKEILMSSNLDDVKDEFEYKESEINKGSLVLTKYTGNKSEIVIPTEIDGVPISTIGESKFEAPDTVTKITILNNIISICDSGFNTCKGLKVIEVSTDNSKYSSLDGVIFDKEKKTLIQIPSQKDISDYSIPNSVQIIGKFSFSNNDTFEKILIPSSVSEIKEWAFFKCNKLEQIDLPNSIVKIGDCAFNRCEKLKRVYATESIQNIGQYAFEMCHESLFIEAPSGTAMEDYAVKNKIEFRIK
jgi:hypothetical protein